VRVAVLDSGIDYTHAALGGEGTVAAYEAAHDDPVDRGGLFPTAKVVEGYDFVGEEWDGDTVTALAPDDDPIDFGGHGTHVADIIGGLSGVAPGVDLYAVKVCSAVASACSGIALIQGMEFAVDPDGDGDTADAVDIINMSLGSDYGQPFDDDLSQAVEAATKLGVLTVASAGNGGDKPYIAGTPSATPAALSVAQTQAPSAALQLISQGGSDLVTAFNPDYPLIRFATGELSTVLTGPSPCGRTNMRIAGCLGRADECANVGGRMVFPGQVDALVRRHASLQRAQLVVARDEGHDAMQLLCEVAGDANGLEAGLAEAVSGWTGLRTRIEFVRPGTLPSNGKLIDDRR
jgi:subtilisin family serine protease